ncbi:MAG: hypothetical protein QGF59_24190, partial [Pirellulaceae bacterium]|nr:hypothetical protein [Pirellulaceae bacterium]
EMVAESHRGAFKQVFLWLLCHDMPRVLKYKGGRETSRGVGRHRRNVSRRATGRGEDSNTGKPVRCTVKAAVPAKKARGHPPQPNPIISLAATPFNRTR